MISRQHMRIIKHLEFWLLKFGLSPLLHRSHKPAVQIQYHMYDIVIIVMFQVLVHTSPIYDYFLHIRGYMQSIMTRRTVNRQGILWSIFVCRKIQDFSTHESHNMISVKSINIRWRLNSVEHQNMHDGTAEQSHYYPITWLPESKWSTVFKVTSMNRPANQASCSCWPDASGLSFFDLLSCSISWKAGDDQSMPLKAQLHHQ